MQACLHSSSVPNLFSFSHPPSTNVSQAPFIELKPHFIPKWASQYGVPKCTKVNQSEHIKFSILKLFQKWAKTFEICNAMDWHIVHCKITFWRKNFCNGLVMSNYKRCQSIHKIFLTLVHFGTPSDRVQRQWEGDSEMREIPEKRRQRKGNSFGLSTFTLTSCPASHTFWAKATERNRRKWKTNIFQFCLTKLVF